jgi:ribosome biogenesis protein Tsr3
MIAKPKVHSPLLVSQHRLPRVQRSLVLTPVGANIVPEDGAVATRAYPQILHVPECCLASESDRNVVQIDKDRHRSLPVTLNRTSLTLVETKPVLKKPKNE